MEFGQPETSQPEIKICSENFFKMDNTPIQGV